MSRADGVYYAPSYMSKKGYKEFKGIVSDEARPDRVYHDYRWYLVGRDLFTTPNEALVIAVKQRTTRLVSLRKQLAKIEALTY